MTPDGSQETRDRIIDDEHLRLLAIGHYLVAGMYILFASLFLFHLAFLIVGATNPQLFGPSHGQPVPSDSFFTVAAVFVGGFIAAGWAFGGLTIYVGRCIKRRTRRGLSIVIACLNTLGFPFGTILGVSTLLVLTRTRVAELYRRT